MEKPDSRIIKFIKKHHVLSLATCVENEPYCASCFYAFNEDDLLFIFSSDEDTVHAKNLEINDVVSGTVHLETELVGKIRGIQFKGKVVKLENEDLKKNKKLYLRRFPYAIAMKTTLWALKVDFIKYTDNRLGFGKKLIWKLND